MKVLLFTFLVITILCGDIQSQSIFLDEQNLSKVAEYNFPHGFGVMPMSAYDKQVAYKEACEIALEELNSNLFLSAYIEQFKTGATTDYSFPELSVKDTVLTYGDEVVKADSFEVAGQAYCISALSNKRSAQIFSIPPLDKLKIGPIKSNGTWYAMGFDKGSIYSPHRSWIKSKNNAIRDLARTITTQVQSSMININYTITEFTYFKSYVIFNDVVVAQRFISPDNKFVSVVAVKESDITDLNK